MRHKILSSVLAALTAASLGCGNGEPPAPAPRVVAVVKPQPLDAVVGATYPGSVRARVETPLSFRVPGKILERKVDVGAHVAKGAELATLDPADARSNLDAARADLALAEAEAIRLRNLKKRGGYVSQSQLDTAENRLRLAKAQHELARNQSAYTTLIADADGTVTQVQAEAGQVVAAGQPVFGFARDGEREVSITVPEGELTALAKAPKLSILLWAHPDKVYEGRLREYSTAADARTRTHEARVSIVAPDENVKLGMTANVLLGADGAKGAFRVPAAAVAQVQGKASVWVVRGAGEEAKAQPVPVKVIQYTNDAVVISGALQAGDPLISAGVHLLTPGMAVRPVDRTAPVAL